MKKILIPFVFLSLLFSSCKYAANNIFYEKNSVVNRVKGLTDLDVDYSGLGEHYSFCVITDIHAGSIKEDAPPLNHNLLLSWIDSLPPAQKPAFCLCLGDVADTGSEEQDLEYLVFVDKIESRGIKVFNAVGNHDIYQSGYDNWEKYCYPHTSFYRFETPDFNFYALDTGTGNIGTKQYNFLKNTLSSDSKPKIIFTHYPLFTDRFFFSMEDTTERNLLIDLCAKNKVKLYISGHIHKYEENDFGSFKTHAIPSYRYQSKWAYVTVDGENTTLSLIAR